MASRNIGFLGFFEDPLIRKLQIFLFGLGSSEYTSHTSHMKEKQAKKDTCGCALFCLIEKLSVRLFPECCY
jgi:hypothetical protein